MAAAATPRMASASILAPSSLVDRGCRAGAPGRVPRSRPAPGPGRTAPPRMTAAVRPATSANRAAAVAPERLSEPGQGDRDDGDARGRQALGQGVLRGEGRAMPGQRRHDPGAAGAETGREGAGTASPAIQERVIAKAGQAGDGQQPPAGPGTERGSGSCRGPAS